MATARIAIPAIPPTTPPAIAPAGVDCVATIGRVDCVGVEEGAPREVSTPESYPPVKDVTRKKSTTNGVVQLAVVTVISIL